MKIVYLHQYFNRPNESGSSRSYEMTRRLVERGHEVHLVTSERDPARRQTGWKEERIEGVQVHSTFVPYSNNYGFGRRLAAFAHFAFKASGMARRLNGDVVIASSTPLTIALPALYATTLKRTKFVLEVRDLWPEVPIALGFLSNPVFRFAALALERVAYRAADHVVALSPGMKSGVVSKGVSSRNVTVIPNAADIALFRTTDLEVQEWRQRQPWLGSGPLVSYCGSMGAVNGVEYLARIASVAIELDPAVTFVAVGKGAQRAVVENVARELGVLNQNFFVLDAMPKSEMRLIFGASALSLSLVVPVVELENNSANKFFDALAAGCPVGINHGGWQADLIMEGVPAGIVMPSSDPYSAAHLLLDFLSDSDRLAAAAASSRDLAKRFDRDLLATRLAVTLENTNE